MNIEEVLADIGLTQNETSIYIALLRAHEATVSQIARTSKVKRTTCYTILRQLCDQGIITRLEKNQRETFRALSPQVLLEEQYKRFSNLEAAIPQLEKLSKAMQAIPSFGVFEGKKGLERVMDFTLEARTPIYAWLDVRQALFTVLKDYYPGYIKRRAKRGITDPAIVPLCSEAIAYQKRDTIESRETRFIPENEFKISNEINVYNDKLVILSHKDEVGVIIQNQSIADTQRSIFQICWKTARAKP